MITIIIEDEKPAARLLQRKLEKLEIKVDVMLHSVEDSIEWFLTNKHPDLIFLDIQLSDGLSFEIFEKVNIKSAVIFTTAYDEYALKAFKVNSIDYLLKPISVSDLSKAFEKWRLLQSTTSSPTFDETAMRQMMQMMTQRIATPPYKTRFMVKIGEHLQTIQAEDIDFLLGENKSVWLYHKNGRKYIVDYTLDQLDELLEPERFFRLNRQFIAAISSIKDVIAYSNSRLKIVLNNPPSKDDIIMSREKVEAFKLWLGK